MVATGFLFIDIIPSDFIIVDESDFIIIDESDFISIADTESVEMARLPMTLRANNFFIRKK